MKSAEVSRNATLNGQAYHSGRLLLLVLLGIDIIRQEIISQYRASGRNGGHSPVSSFGSTAVERVNEQKYTLLFWLTLLRSARKLSLMLKVQI